MRDCLYKHFRAQKVHKFSWGWAPATAPLAAVSATSVAEHRRDGDPFARSENLFRLLRAQCTVIAESSDITWLIWQKFNFAPDFISKLLGIFELFAG